MRVVSPGQIGSADATWASNWSAWIFGPALGHPATPTPSCTYPIIALAAQVSPPCFHFDFSVSLRPRHPVLSRTGDPVTSCLAIPRVFRSTAWPYDPPRSLRQTLTRPSAFADADVARPTRRPLDVPTTADRAYSTVHPRHPRRTHARALAHPRTPLSLRVSRIGRISGLQLPAAGRRTAAIRQPRTAYINTPGLGRPCPDLAIGHSSFLMRSSCPLRRAFTRSPAPGHRCPSAPRNPKHHPFAWILVLFTVLFGTRSRSDSDDLNDANLAHSSSGPPSLTFPRRLRIPCFLASGGAHRIA